MRSMIAASTGSDSLKCETALRWPLAFGSFFCLTHPSCPDGREVYHRGENKANIGVAPENGLSDSVEQNSMRPNTRVVSSFGDSNDYFLSRSLVRHRIGDEDSNGQPPSIGQSDQSNVIGRVRQPVDDVGRP